MSIFYRLYQSKNDKSVTYGKWYGRAVTMGETVSLEDLAEHMAQHNSPYSEGVIKGVLTDMVNCIRELVLEGKAVKTQNYNKMTSQLSRMNLHGFMHWEMLNDNCVPAKTGVSGHKKIGNNKRTSAEGKFFLVTPAGFKPTTF